MATVNELIQARQAANMWPGMSTWFPGGAPTAHPTAPPTVPPTVPPDVGIESVTGSGAPPEVQVAINKGEITLAQWNDLVQERGNMKNPPSIEVFHAALQEKHKEVGRGLSFGQFLQQHWSENIGQEGERTPRYGTNFMGTEKKPTKSEEEDIGEAAADVSLGETVETTRYDAGIDAYGQPNLEEVRRMRAGLPPASRLVQRSRARKDKAYSSAYQLHSMQQALKGGDAGSFRDYIDTVKDKSLSELKSMIKGNLISLANNKSLMAGLSGQFRTGDGDPSEALHVSDTVAMIGDSTFDLQEALVQSMSALNPFLSPTAMRSTLNRRFRAREDVDPSLITESHWSEIAPLIRSGQYFRE